MKQEGHIPKIDFRKLSREEIVLLVGAIITTRQVLQTLGFTVTIKKKSFLQKSTDLTLQSEK